MAKIQDLSCLWLTQKEFLITQKEDVPNILFARGLMITKTSEQSQTAFSLKNPIFQEDALIKSFSSDFKAEAFDEETTLFDEDQLKGRVRQVRLDRFCLIMKDLQASGDYTLEYSGNSNFFKLHFELEGDYCYTPTNTAEPEISIPAGQFNIVYFSQPQGMLNFKAGTRKTLEVLFTEDFLKKTVGADFSGLSSRLRKGIKKKLPFTLWDESKPIPGELLQNIRDIISCRYCGHIRKIYLEARITALLVNFLVDDSQNTPDLEGRELTKKENSGILRVEEHIRNNFRENITIAELAPIAGLNTSKLKQVFKQVYATTIFKYITRLRMETAKGLIENEKLSIAEASYDVGYKNPQHFTVAFKKYYGFLPSTIKEGVE